MCKMVSTRTGFGQGLVELAEQRRDVMAASADTYRSFALGEFVKKYPERYYEFGIAEQNMLTASGAMAAEGYCIFAVGYSPFLSMRALEQIRTFIAYPNLNVKVVAGLSGLSGDTDGVTHQGTEDIGIMRTIPNVTLLCPADATAARAFVKIAADIEGPVYLRLGRGATPILYGEDQTFVLGKAIQVRKYGKKAVVIACGSCVYEAALAADTLKEKGTGITVLDMHTITHPDTESIVECCKDADSVITVEDGTIYGLGSVVAETLIEYHVFPKHFKRLGLTGFGTAGTYPELLHFYGLDAEGIAAAVKQAVN